MDGEVASEIFLQALEKMKLKNSTDEGRLILLDAVWKASHGKKGDKNGKI